MHLIDKNTVAFMIYLDTWLSDDEYVYDLTEADIKELYIKWVYGWLPGLNEDHHGDCTREPMPCMRCTMDNIMNNAEKISSICNKIVKESTE